MSHHMSVISEIDDRIRQLDDSYWRRHARRTPDDLRLELAYVATSTPPAPPIDQILAQDQLGFRHPNFEVVAKKMENVDNFLDKPFEVSEGAETCVKCHKNQTISYSKQVRSADEGMTVFIQCVNPGCMYRYKLSS